MPWGRRFELVNNAAGHGISNDNDGGGDDGAHAFDAVVTGLGLLAM